MKFPVDILTTVDPKSLEQSAKDYMSELLYKNPEKHEFLSLPESKTINIGLCNVGFVPLYGVDIKEKVLAVFSPEDAYKAVGLYLNGQWWSAEDILQTRDTSRTGLIEVRTLGERIVLYVLNRIIYRTKEMAEDDVRFLCHGEDEIAKILWKDGEAIGFYSVKPEGSYCYHLPVMETIFVRKSHRGKGHSLQMLEDFIVSFRKNDMGLKCPLSTAMYKVCKKYLSTHPADKDLLWEVEGAGGPFQRTQIANKLLTMEFTGNNNEQIVCKLSFDTEKTDAPREGEIALVKDTVEYTEVVEEVVHIRTTKNENETLGMLCAACSNLKHKEMEDTIEEETEKIIREEDSEPGIQSLVDEPMQELEEHSHKVIVQVQKDVTLEDVSELHFKEQTKLNFEQNLQEVLSKPAKQPAIAILSEVLETEENTQTSAGELQGLRSNEEILTSLNTTIGQVDPQPLEVPQLVEMEIAELTSETKEICLYGNTEVDPKTSGEITAEMTTTEKSVLLNDGNQDLESTLTVKETTESVQEEGLVQKPKGKQRGQQRITHQTLARHPKKLHDQLPEGELEKVLTSSTETSETTLKHISPTKKQKSKYHQNIRYTVTLKETQEIERNTSKTSLLELQNLRSTEETENMDTTIGQDLQPVEINQVVEMEIISMTSKPKEVKVIESSNIEVDPKTTGEIIQPQKDEDQTDLIEITSTDQDVEPDKNELDAADDKSYTVSELVEKEDLDRAHILKSTGRRSNQRKSNYLTPLRHSKRLLDQTPDGEPTKKVLRSITKCVTGASRKLHLQKIKGVKQQLISPRQTQVVEKQTEAKQAIVESEGEQKNETVKDCLQEANIEDANLQDAKRVRRTPEKVNVLRGENTRSAKKKVKQKVAQHFAEATEIVSEEMGAAVAEDIESVTVKFTSKETLGIYTGTHEKSNRETTSVKDVKITQHTDAKQVDEHENKETVSADDAAAEEMESETVIVTSNDAVVAEQLAAERYVEEKAPEMVQDEDGQKAEEDSLGKTVTQMSQPQEELDQELEKTINTAKDIEERKGENSKHLESQVKSSENEQLDQITGNKIEIVVESKDTHEKVITEGPQEVTDERIEIEKRVLLKDGGRDLESTQKEKTEGVQEEELVQESTGKHRSRHRSTHHTNTRRSKRIHVEHPEDELMKIASTSSTTASETTLKQMSPNKKQQTKYHQNVIDSFQQKETQKLIQRFESEPMEDFAESQIGAGVEEMITSSKHNKMVEDVDNTDISRNKDTIEQKEDVVTLKSASGSSHVQETLNETITISTVYHDAHDNNEVQDEMHDGKPREEAVTETADDREQATASTSIVKLQKAAVVLVDCNKVTNESSEITPSLLNRSETAKEEIAFSELKEQESKTDAAMQETVESSENNTPVGTGAKQDFVAITVTKKLDSKKEHRKHSAFSHGSTVQKSTVEEDTTNITEKSLRTKTPNESACLQKTHLPQDSEKADIPSKVSVHENNQTALTNNDTSKSDITKKNVQDTNEESFNMDIQKDKLVNQELNQSQFQNQVKEAENKEKNQTTGSALLLKKSSVQEEDEISTCIAQHLVEEDDKQPKGEVAAMENTVKESTVDANVTSSGLESTEDESAEIMIITKHLRSRTVTAISPPPKKSQWLSTQILKPHLMKIQAQASKTFCEKEVSEVEREESESSNKQQRTNISKDKAIEVKDNEEEKHMLIESADSASVETITGKSEEKDVKESTTNENLDQVEDSKAEKRREFQKRKRTLLIEVTSEKKSKRYCIEQENTSHQEFVKSTEDLSVADLSKNTSQDEQNKMGYN